MSLHPGYSIQHGAMVFSHPIEGLWLEVAEGHTSILVTTANGVVRVDSDDVPKMQRPRWMLPFRPRWDDYDWGH